MKATFIYTPIGGGYKIEEHYDEIPKLPDSDQYDYKEYCKCLKAILKTVEDNLRIQGEWHKDLVELDHDMPAGSEV